MGRREGQTTAEMKQAGNGGGQSGSRIAGSQGPVVRDAAFKKRMALIRARAAQAIDEELSFEVDNSLRHPAQLPGRLDGSVHLIGSLE